MAALLLGELKQKIKGLTLEPAGGGVFEVSVDGKEIWSKQKSGKFPDEQALLRVVTTGR